MAKRTCQQYAGKDNEKETNSFDIIDFANLSNFVNQKKELEVFLASWEVNNFAELNSKIAEWVKRPTQADFDREQQVKTKAITDLVQEQNKSKQLEIEKNNRPDIALTEYNELLTNKNLPIDEKPNNPVYLI